MNKLLVVAPNASIYQSALEIVSEARLDARVIQATSETIIDQVQQEMGSCSGVIVARGHQAQLLKAQVKIPVVDIVMSSMDMIILLDRARKILGTAHPRIACIGFRYMFPDCTALTDILDVDPCIYYAHSGKDVPQVVERAAHEGAVFIIGGEMACRHAEKLGLPSLFIDSMKESIRIAIRQAIHMMNATVLEQRRTAEFSSLLNYSFDAILKLNSQGVIETANFQAEKLLHQSLSQLQGQNFFQLPGLQITPVLTEALQQHRSLHSTIIRIGSESFVANVASIVVEDVPDAFILSMQAFSTIDELEETIRLRRRQQGYVAKFHFEDHVPHSPLTQTLVADAKQYAQYDVPILLDGAAGLPKAEIAQCIHNSSLRNRSPFVSVDLSTLPIATQTDYLFGSDVVPTTKGIISLAHTGTLFLLDVHLLTNESQHQLLNVLRNGQYYRRGNNTPVPVSARIICSTFKHLNTLAREGHFSEPLAHTLTSITLTTPSIADVPEEIPALLNRFLDEASTRFHKPLSLTSDALGLLTKYAWPGNVREIEVFCQRAAMLSPSPVLDTAFIKTRLLPQLVPASPEEAAPVLVVVDPEENEVRIALRQAQGNRQKAAELLGVSRSSLWRRMKKYQIDP